MFLRACLTFLWFANLFPHMTAPHELTVTESAREERSTRDSRPAGQTTATEECTLKGRVVNSVTGEPIRNALVQVTREKLRSMLTLADGSFQFEGLPAGEGSVVVRKPGYFTESDVHPLSAGIQRVIVAHDAPPVTLKLVPEGVIFGTIQGEDGEPVEGVAVALIRLNRTTGRKLWERGETDTDELGRYRFAELAPGTYYLSAGKWVEAAANGRAKAGLPKAKGYPTEYYPGVSDFAAATPIKIVAGKRMQIDLSMAEKPLYRVAGTITGYAEASGVALQMADMTGEVLVVEPKFDPRTGRFQFAALPRGSFTIMAQGVDVAGQPCFAKRQLNVNADVSNLQLHLARASTIPVYVRREFSRGQADEDSPQEAPPVNIGLAPQGGASSGEPRVATRIGGDSSGPRLVIAEVQPGTYAVQMETTESVYVYSAKYGSIDLLREDITIDADSPAQSIEVVVRDDGAALGGVLTSDRRKTSGAVLMVPARAPRLLRLVAADSNGSFQFSNLAPGNYTVVGLDHVEDVEYREADFLQKYLRKGQEITLSPGQSTAIQLELVHVGE